MRAYQEKYIDLDQFKHDDNGRIAWKNNIGVKAQFLYNGNIHTVEILDYLRKDYLKIQVDDVVFESAHTSKITNLNFSSLFYEPNYLFSPGSVIGNIRIIDKCVKYRDTEKQKHISTKAYTCECLIDGHNFVITETALKDGGGCPVCSNKIVLRGINDISTTHPYLVRFFVNKEDAHSYSFGSEKNVDVICPNCKSIKKMRIADLSKYGYVTCDICSDGISYPNKFAHSLFTQISDQYIEYKWEYSPDWAKKYRFDNYFKLGDGSEIVVEMDGCFHFMKGNSILENDRQKEKLLREHNISLYRINCNYSKVDKRFLHIKTAIIDALSPVFNLSDIDWDLCNTIATSDYLIVVANFYKNNPKLGLPEIADHFKISLETLYGYLHSAEDLGLCEYVRNDKNRIKNSKPIAMYDLSDELVGIYKSAKEIEELFPHIGFKHRSIRKAITRNASGYGEYRGYRFRFASFKEYQST